MRTLNISSAFIAGVALLALSVSTIEAAPLKNKLAGRIVLQVESKGKAWYVNPTTKERVYLGRKEDAFRVMREFGVGISNKNLQKLATSEESKAKNEAFARSLAGKILLQVEANGEAWYVNPTTLKRHYLGRPDDAYNVMRGVGLGIANKDIDQIPVTQKYADPEQSTILPGAPSSLAPVPPSSIPPIKPAPVKEISKNASGDMSGSYRCWSYNVSGGGGGDCRLFAPIVLKSDNTYSMSSEKGTYAVSGTTINLSESKLRGPGTIIEGNKIRFEYDYNGWHHVVTYLKEGGSTAASGAAAPVQVTLEYPKGQTGLSGIATIELAPIGEDLATSPNKTTTIAQWDGANRIVASFDKATNQPARGKKYTVYANSGFSAWSVGTIDLTTAGSYTKAIIQVLSSGTGSQDAKQSDVTPSTAPEIVVEIDLVAPEKDRSLGNINFVTLIPENDDPTTAIYKPIASAIWDGDRTVVASFHKSTNQVKTKARYTIYEDTGFGLTSVGTLDLTSVTSGPYKKIITLLSSTTTSSSTSSSGTSSTSSSSGTSTSSATLPLCTPNVPSYSQPACRTE